jgi:orotidine-5'-phosphate decarboxylase
MENSSQSNISSPNISSQVIVALDFPSLKEALFWCDHLPEVEFWKVGLELFIAAGGEVISELKQRRKKVFLDLKLHDIPNTVAKACEVAAKYEVDFLTVHGSGGKPMLQAASLAVSGSQTELLVVTLLTSISARELAIDLKVNLELPEYVLHLALMAEELGINGVVCSPHEMKLLRSQLSSNFNLVTPGIRLAQDQAGDQKRIMTPNQAIAAGANYLVIGRSILAAKDPIAAWQECVRSRELRETI